MNLAKQTELMKIDIEHQKLSPIVMRLLQNRFHCRSILDVWHLATRRELAYVWPHGKVRIREIETLLKKHGVAMRQGEAAVRGLYTYTSDVGIQMHEMQLCEVIETALDENDSPCVVRRWFNTKYEDSFKTTAVLKIEKEINFFRWVWSEGGANRTLQVPCMTLVKKY